MRVTSRGMEQRCVASWNRNAASTEECWLVRVAMKIAALMDDFESIIDNHLMIVDSSSLIAACPEPEPMMLRTTGGGR